jgi:hypothetical protein
MERIASALLEAEHNVTPTPEHIGILLADIGFQDAVECALRQRAAAEGVRRPHADALLR